MQGPMANSELVSGQDESKLPTFGLTGLRQASQVWVDPGGLL
jgi:hypothetical protein